MNPIRRAAELLSACRRLAILTGAGVSAESGVPTFRGPQGFWKGRDPLTLATPQAFADDPATVWQFYNDRRACLSRIQPNPAHQAIAELENRLPRVTLITQNVDRLHRRAGSRNILELHGNLDEIRCSRCDHTENQAGVSLPNLPKCSVCGALCRPAVVWFGENLPRDVWRKAEAAVRDADLLLVVGTSALVYPAAGLIESARSANLFVMEINLEPTPFTDAVSLSIPGKAGEILPLIVRDLSVSPI